MKHPIGKRLLSAAEFVRQGAYFADIGTDHAYLPLFLLEEGKITRAVCADINAGPLDSAKNNAEEYGLSDKIIFRLTNGAVGLSDMGITDYAICGMGGELIAEIIEASDHLKRTGVRLILQPMSKQSHLRRYLARRGFLTVGEKYSYDAGKYYLCLAAEYTGECREIGDFEAEFGKDLTRASFSPEKQGYFDEKIKSLEKTAKGKIKGGEQYPPEAQLLKEYMERTKK